MFFLSPFHPDYFARGNMFFIFRTSRFYLLVCEIFLSLLFSFNLLSVWVCSWSVYSPTDPGMDRVDNSPAVQPRPWCLLKNKVDVISRDPRRIPASPSPTA